MCSVVCFFFPLLPCVYSRLYWGKKKVLIALILVVIKLCTLQHPFRIWSLLVLTASCGELQKKNQEKLGNFSNESSYKFQSFRQAFPPLLPETGAI